jgi:hypothetical protein
MRRVFVGYGTEDNVVDKISARVFFKQLSSPLESTFDAINNRFNDHVTKIEKAANIMEKGRQLLKEKLNERKKAGTNLHTVRVRVMKKAG